MHDNKGSKTRWNVYPLILCGLVFFRHHCYDILHGGEQQGGEKGGAQGADQG